MLIFSDITITERWTIFVCFARFRQVLPLPNEVSKVFAALPEYYLEDVAEFTLFVAQ